MFPWSSGYYAVLFCCVAILRLICIRNRLAYCWSVEKGVVFSGYLVGLPALLQNTRLRAIVMIGIEWATRESQASDQSLRVEMCGVRECHDWVVRSAVGGRVFWPLGLFPPGLSLGWFGEWAKSRDFSTRGPRNCNSQNGSNQGKLKRHLELGLFLARVSRAADTMHRSGEA